MLPRVFGPFRGRAQGRRFVIRSEGGGSQSRMVRITTHLSILPGPVRVFGARPDDPSRVSGEGTDGSDPPLVDRWRGQSGGSLPSYVSLQEGSPARERPDDQTEREAPCLTLSYAPFSSSAVSVPWPRGRGRACFRGRSRRGPRPLPHAELLRGDRRLVLRRAGRGRVPHRPISHQHAADLVARMGVSLGLRSSLPAWPLSPTSDGPAIVIGEVHHPVRAVETPNPEWLMIPERGLYTGVAIFGAVGSGKSSACMHPFAWPALELASQESRAATGRARPGSQGRLLSRHPRDPQRRGPRRRLR